MTFVFNDNKNTIELVSFQGCQKFFIVIQIKIKVIAIFQNFFFRNAFMTQ